MKDEHSVISENDFNFSQEVIEKLAGYFSRRVVGQEKLKFSLVAAVIADGHVLIESVPGLAKTTAAKAIADAVHGRFSRIQCTPDLLPSDIIGTQIYHQHTGKFETMFGPVFANFVLLDEVNRSSAKTQSAMLEAMQERQVTIGGTTYRMPQDVFIVIATQVKGSILFHDWMYPSRMYFTDKLVGMGAQIVLCDPHRCIVQGPTRLYPENLESPDIRAGMALLLATLATPGKSTIRNIGQIERGYERVDEKLNALGARITRI